MKSREQDRLAAEARLRANEAAYGGFNRQLLNRWKVCVLSTCNQSWCCWPHPVDGISQL